MHLDEIINSWEIPASKKVMGLKPIKKEYPAWTYRIYVYALILTPQEIREKSLLIRDTKKKSNNNFTEISYF